MNNGMNQIKNILFSCGVSNEEYQKIRADIIESNRKSLIVYSRLAAVFLALASFGAYSIVPYIRQEAKILIGIAIAMLIISIMAQTIAKKNQERVKTVCYIFAFLLFGMGIHLSSIGNPNERAVTFIAFILTIPLIFTDIPIRVFGALVITDIVFIITDYFVKPSDIFRADVLNCIVYSTFSGITALYMITNKVEKYIYQAKVVVLSETDQLTNLKNRNYFEFKKNQYKESGNDNLSCIYVDANGLHELNNNYGHEAGDKMLKCIADSIVEEFGREDAYRVGGDEFVVFTVDTEEAVINDRIQRLKETIDRNMYHAAIGKAFEKIDSVDVHKLIKTAESEMYSDKKKYYEQLGNDRRSR